MRQILKKLAYNAAALWLLSTLIPSITYGNTLYLLLLTASTLTLFEFIIQPVIQLLLLPLNLLLLGLLSWVPFAISLYLLTITLETFSITGFSIDQSAYLNVTIPNLHFGKLTTIILSSFLIKLLKKSLTWLFK